MAKKKNELLLNDLREGFKFAFPDSAINLDFLPSSDRIYGSINWSGFVGYDMVTRQAMVRQVIRALVGSKENKVSTIIALTVAEANGQEPYKGPGEEEYDDSEELDKIDNDCGPGGIPDGVGGCIYQKDSHEDEEDYSVEDKEESKSYSDYFKNKNKKEADYECWLNYSSTSELIGYMVLHFIKEDVTIADVLKQIQFIFEEGYELGESA